MANIDEMKQEAKDAKDAAKAEKAYMDSLTTTKPAPKPKKMAKGGSVAPASKRPSVKKFRYNDGGVVANSNYPFGQGQVSAAPAPTSTGLGNNSPLVQVNASGAEATETSAASQPFGMKKGGAVKSRTTTRGDGIAQRGRTKGRFV